MSKKQPLRPEIGERVSLHDYATDYTGDYEHKHNALEHIEHNRVRLGELQEVLYAEHKHAVLIVLQAMDAGGKDGTIRHVMSGINPQGVQVTSFKVPTPEEIDHDFSVAYPPARPGTGHDRYFQPLALRRCADRARE